VGVYFYTKKKSLQQTVAPLVHCEETCSYVNVKFSLSMVYGNLTKESHGYIKPPYLELLTIWRRIFF